MKNIPSIAIDAKATKSALSIFPLLANIIFS